MDTVHEHPLNRDETIVGQRVQPKQRLEQGDNLAHPSGKWLKIRLEDIGRIASEFPSVIFIRPKK